jgi:hypothetical protein
MSFSRLLRKLSQPSLVPIASTDAGSSPSADEPNGRSQRRQSSEPTRTVPRPWRRKRPSTAGQSSISRQTSTPPLAPKAEGPTPQGGVPEMPPPVPILPDPSVFLTNLAMVPPPEMILVSSPVQDKLAEAWDEVKGDPVVANISRELDAVGVCSLPVLLFRGNLILASR